MICLATDLAALIMISQYWNASSADAFGCVIAVIVPLAFLFGFVIRMCAGACCQNIALVTAGVMNSSTLLGREMLTSILTISCLSARLNLDVVASVGFSHGIIVVWCLLWFIGGTVSHRLGDVASIIVVVSGGCVGVGNWAGDSFG